MKKLGTMIVVALMASVLTAGILLLTGTRTEKVFTVEQVQTTPVAKTNYDLPPIEHSEMVDFKTAAKKVTPAVVHIKSSRTVTQSQSHQQYIPDEWMEKFFGPQGGPQRGPDVRMGSGSGVIISEDGFVVTNNHVIDAADEIEVTLNDNRSFKATLIGTDPSTDIAVLKLEEKGLPFLRFSNSDLVEIGEWVMAVGNPFNLNSTVTAGIVSAKGRNINILKDKSAIESFIQTDAAINPGNSGGALCALDGSIIGINTAIASPTGAYSGYGFAVPSNIVNKVVEDLMKHGVVQRGYLGVYIRGINSDLAKEHDLDLNSGVYVSDMMDESAAKEAGVKKGDVILKVDGVEVSTAPELQELIGQKRPGDQVTLDIDRDGEAKLIAVTLKNSSGKAEIVKKEAKSLNDILGVTMKTVDKSLARKLEIDGGVQITSIEKGKIQKQTTMKKGFIVTKVDGKKVTSDQDLMEILKQKQEGGVLLEGIYEDVPGTQYYAFGMD